METVSEKAQRLVSENIHQLNTGRRLKLQTWLSKPAAYTSDFFEADFVQICDSYESRLQSNKEFGQFTDGLDSLLQNMQGRHEAVPKLRLTSFFSPADHILLFSDPDYSVFLGLLIFPPVPKTCPEGDKTAAIETLLFDAFEEFRLFLNENEIFGRETEIKNAFFTHILLPKCSENSVLFHPGQIVLEGAVPQIKEEGINHTKQVTFDMVFWPKPKMTCFNAQGKAVHFPLAIVEWKVRPIWGKGKNHENAFRKDIAKMKEYRRQYSNVLCCAVLVKTNPSAVLIYLNINGKDKIIGQQN